MVTFLTSILSSNFGRDIHYYEVSGFPQYLQENARIILNHATIASFHISPVHYSLIMLLFYAMQSEL
jgi:hypothetical protein